MGAKQSQLSVSYVNVPERDPKWLQDLNTVPARLTHFANTIPKKEALVFVSTDGGREAVTFEELNNRCSRTARALIDLGVRRYEYVAINMRSCPEWLYITFGAMMAGACPLGISFTYKDGSDLVGVMTKLQACSCLVFDSGFQNENWNILSKLLDEYSPSGKVASERMPSLRYLIHHDKGAKPQGILTVKELLQTDMPNVNLPEVHAKDVAILFQTSGSTGIPKAVVHTHLSLLQFKSVEHAPVFTTDYIYFCDRPMNWVGGFPFSPLFGQTRVTVSGFCDPPSDRAGFLIDTVQKENCQVILGLPPLLLEVLERKDTLVGNWPLKTILTGGQPLTKKFISSLCQLCKYTITVYGATECVLFYAGFSSEPGDFDDFSCGYPLPGIEIKIIDADGKIVPIKTRGEIYVRSTGLFSRYANDEERTRAAFTEDGWYRTDDVGVMRKDGSLRVEGRNSNMIISGGMNVSPEILEHLIRKCPGVQSTILVPVPDDVLHQVICACVIIVPESTVNEEDIRRFCEEAHGDKRGLFTVLPKYYMILERFPETRTGKTSRPLLEEMAKERFGENM